MLPLALSIFVSKVQNVLKITSYQSISSDDEFFKKNVCKEVTKRQQQTEAVKQLSQRETRVPIAELLCNTMSREMSVKY